MGGRPRFSATVRRLLGLNYSPEKIAEILRVTDSTVLNFISKNYSDFRPRHRDVWYEQWVIRYLQGENPKKIIANYPGVDELDFWQAYYSYYKNRNSAWIGRVKRKADGAPVTWRPGEGITTDEWKFAIQRFTVSTVKALREYLTVPEEDDSKFVWEALHWSYWRDFTNNKYVEDHSEFDSYRLSISPALIYKHVFEVDKLQEISLILDKNLNEIVSSIMKYPSLFTLCVDLNLLTRNGSVVNEPTAKQLNIYHSYVGYGTDITCEMFKCSKKYVEKSVSVVEKHRTNRGIVKRKYHENCDWN